MTETDLLILDGGGGAVEIASCLPCWEKKNRSTRPTPPPPDDDAGDDENKEALCFM